MTPREIRSARLALRMSIREFAAAVTDPTRTACGYPPVSARSVRHWEAGERPVPEFVERRVRQLMFEDA